MSEVYNDPAWDEYLSTGIDPTGGELDPDYESESEASNEGNKNED